MNIEDLGKYFIKNNELYYAIGYIDRPALELKNIITGQKETVVIDSPVSKEYRKLFSIPVDNNSYDIDKAIPVDNIKIIGSDKE